MACHAQPIEAAQFNPKAAIPYGCAIEHIYKAMSDYLRFLEFINMELHRQRISRLESMLMPANFSSIVGEFMCMAIPRYCPNLTRNQYHNGHPDLIPAGIYPDNTAQHAHEGIEIKASRYLRGWQGHNPENIWLMVFVFDSNRPADSQQGLSPKPFRFVSVLGAQLTEADWSFAGRSAQSRRTITASVTGSGYDKLVANWIYQA